MVLYFEVPSNLLSQPEILSTGQTYNQTSRASPTFRLPQHDLSGVLGRNPSPAASSVFVNCDDMDLVFFHGQIANNTTIQAQVRCLTMNSLSSRVMTEALFCTGLVGAHLRTQITRHSSCNCHYTCFSYTRNSRYTLTVVIYSRTYTLSQCNGGASVLVTCRLSCCQL